MGIGSSKVPIAGQVVIITGCDTGFGRDVALQLSASPYSAIVYATCLTDAAVKDYERIKTEQGGRYSSTLRPRQLDVTNWADVQKFAAKIEEECPEGIFCVINNAGINLGGLFSWTEVSEFQKVMDVNYMGTVHMMKALLPSLLRYVRKNPNSVLAPRIVNIASVAARTVAPILAAYCPSKHAVEAVSSAARMDLAPLGIRVAVIEPWFAGTPMVLGGVEQRLANLKSRFLTVPHREELGESFLDTLVSQLGTPPPLTMDPKQVVDTILKTVEATEPSARQVVGFIGAVVIFFVQLLPLTWIDRLATSRSPVLKSGLVRNGRQGRLL
ncbi:uncharacterized protein EV422DRAFT_534431 [Fimicolochytrium jonesii]|uniref:uncharacterized protein n=1 Tax=Fimicolochytrium jonesii TaxID=1396493 RepID=UPI0022FF404B|nr:uncharacterized protein EV422DRAFT_534431 [Fimicolochytrium jonesii]KAI8819356.1 hypothetical protein EV422DRAFT_534431 [Fimicolochytrium jonesii]